MADGSIRNTYELRLRNKQAEDKTFSVGAENLEGEPLPDLAITLEGGRDKVTVTADQTFEQRVYLTAQPGSVMATSGQTPLTLWIEDADSGRRAAVETVFTGTER